MRKRCVDCDRKTKPADGQLADRPPVRGREWYASGVSLEGEAAAARLGTRTLAPGHTRTDAQRRGARLGLGHVALGPGAVMPAQREFLLVLDDLPVELVGERVDRGVHVRVDGLDMDVLAARMEVDF